jgi:hypothetical protein
LTIRETILAFLSENPTASPAELYAVMPQYKKHSIRARLSELKSEGLLARPERGVYAPTDESKKIIYEKYIRPTFPPRPREPDRMYRVYVGLHYAENNNYHNIMAFGWTAYYNVIEGYYEILTDRLERKYKQLVGYSTDEMASHGALVSWYRGYDEEAYNDEKIGRIEYEEVD